MSGPELYSTVRREGGRAETPRGALHSLSVLGVSDGDCRSSVRGVARAKLRYEYIYIEREHGSRAPHTRRVVLTHTLQGSIPAVRLTNTIAFILNSLVCGGATSSFVRWEDADV